MLKKLLQINPKSSRALLPKLLLEMGRERSPNFTRIHNHDVILIKAWDEVMFPTTIGNSMEEFSVFIPLFDPLNMRSLFPIHLLLLLDFLQINLKLLFLLNLQKGEPSIFLKVTKVSISCINVSFLSLMDPKVNFT